MLRRNPVTKDGISKSFLNKIITSEKAKKENDETMIELKPR